MKFDSTNKPTGVRRIFLALSNSARALRWLAYNESAFRQELILLLITFGVIFTVDFSLYEKVMMLCATLFVMFAEIVNTAIEAIVDRVGLEIHPLSGLAKDLGSAGVFIAIIVFFCIWGSCFYTNYFSL
ncbi:diacylglycerol kinase [Pseudoalteromonas sp. JBTF-M23]|uniref:Diacylglycerol kinase n=1 Tax=Pseudoalteromonas caenipelagi TaxID=2726988 RepID=A0A849VFV4_9GAMM|nr:diacylglycerol kinase [Pseudoalteromonas caenipelagi]NOU52156.1 diacylglycerol kinase [Pseudoalteromonas caenipelagi]